MALSKDEQSMLDKLLKKQDEPDDADDFEVEVGEGDKYARVPFSKAKAWLTNWLGDVTGIAAEDAEPPADDDDKPVKKPAPKKAEGGEVRAFGRRIA